MMKSVNAKTMKDMYKMLTGGELTLAYNIYNVFWCRKAKPPHTRRVGICGGCFMNSYLNSISCYKNKLPIWKTIADTTQANRVVYPAANPAHFQLPVSPLMAAMVAIHGKYKSTNSRKQ